MLNPDDMLTITWGTYLRSYIAQRIKISDIALRNMSIHEIRDSYCRMTYQIIQAFYHGKPVDVKETVTDSEEIPINWWHMLWDSVLPQKWKIRKYLRYRTIIKKTEQFQTIYNVCPHMNTDSEAKHYQWLESDPEQSLGLTSLLRILRTDPGDDKLSNLRNVWYDQITGKDSPRWDILTVTIADLIELALERKS